MPPSTPRPSFSLQDALRLRNRYRDKITSLQQSIDDGEDKVEELEARVSRQKELCERARNGDRNVYERQLQELKNLQKQLKKVTALVLQLIDGLRQVRQLRERRVRMLHDQNGIFPLRDITNRRQFGGNRQQ